MISPVGFAIYLGTFSCPAWLSHITGSRPNQADSKGTLALFTPTQEIALAPEPLLTFTCPKTKDRTPTRVEADARTLRALEIQAAGQMPILRRGARNFRA